MKSSRITSQKLREERMIDAGLELFLQFGYRGVSMGAVAEKAEVAKPTLYKYFADKEAIFLAGVVRFIVKTKQICEMEFSKNCSTIDRISGALSAKHKLFYRLVENSQFADELYSETARIAAKDFGDFENWLAQRIEEILVAGGEEKASTYTQLLLACSMGIAKKSSRVEQIGPAIRLITQKLLQ